MREKKGLKFLMPIMDIMLKLTFTHKQKSKKPNFLKDTQIILKNKIPVKKSTIFFTALDEWAKINSFLSCQIDLLLRGCQKNYIPH